MMVRRWRLRQLEVIANHGTAVVADGREVLLLNNHTISICEHGEGNKGV
jgi:hypothetical protein